MSSAVFVEPLAFGPDPKSKDNPLITSMTVSNAQDGADKAQACSTAKEMALFLKNDCGYDACTIQISCEPRPYRVPLEEKGGAVCVGNSMSFHNFTNADGEILRRLVVFYPMSPTRQGELPRKQVLNQITKIAEASEEIELIDLRPFEETQQYLEGSASVVFSADGDYVYMALSKRSDEEVLDVLCNPENLDVPPQNRFIFFSNVPGYEPGAIPHTNVLGWCGRGICAWAISCIGFESEGEREAFYNHLGDAYDCVLQLSVEEMASFCGNAQEVEVVSAAEEPTLYLMMSESAFAALRSENQDLLIDWYGEGNVRTFYGEVLERRMGTSIQSCMAVSYTVGPVPPNPTQRSTVDLLELGKNK